MDFEITCDPTCIIIHRDTDLVIYYQIETQESWLIYGKCSHNGSCIDGAINPDLRNSSERLDCPVRPEIDCKDCSISGIYLNGY